MKITNVHIQNYKSIKNLEFQPSPKINVFIGENSVGKSNLIDAIYWLLGPVFPSFNSTMTQDHYLGKLENNIKIDLNFDDDNTLSLAEIWKDKYNNSRSGLSKNGNYINADDRKNYCSAYLDVRRNVVDYLPSNRWSLLGRFLQDVNDLFLYEKTQDNQLKSDILKKELTSIRDKLLFTVKDQNGTEVLPTFLESVRVECAKQLNRNPSEFNLDMNIYDPWNFYRTLQILVTDPESGLKFQASSMGMGIQASLSIAILKAYSKLKLANNSPIFIDEPELFLHPQAQRNFYHILTELADSGTQIFLTTHSPAFIDLSKFNQIFLVKKSKEKGTFVRTADPCNFLDDLKCRHPTIHSSHKEMMKQYSYAYENTGDSQKANEAFFAKKIILVEGESESLILPYFFKLSGFDYIAENIAIVRCGGKSELDRFYRLYSEFGIPCFIIFDGDNQLEDNKHMGAVKKNREILELFNNISDFPDDQVHDNYLGFNKCLEYNLNLNGIPSAKGLNLYKKVKLEIKDQEDVPKWVTEIIHKIRKLPTEADSILKSTQKKSLSSPRDSQ